MKDFKGPQFTKVIDQLSFQEHRHRHLGRRLRHLLRGAALLPLHLPGDQTPPGRKTSAGELLLQLLRLVLGPGPGLSGLIGQGEKVFFIFIGA